MTIYNQEPLNGNFDDATKAILNTIHSDDEDELDVSTNDEHDDAMIDNNQNITTILRIIILLTVIKHNNFMIVIIRVSLIQRFV